MLLVCPASADVIAKMVGGICDSLAVSCARGASARAGSWSLLIFRCLFAGLLDMQLSVARAWDRRKPIVLCPAMNTYMWKHPVTKAHLNKLKGLGCHVVAPVKKRLACKDTGVGAIAPVHAIIQEMSYAFWYAKHGRLIRISVRAAVGMLAAGLLWYLLQDVEEYYIEEVASSLKRFRLPRLKVTAEWKV